MDRKPQAQQHQPSSLTVVTFTLPPTPADWFGVRLDRLEIAGCTLWRVSIRGRDRKVDRELFDQETLARDWAILQADARYLPYLDFADPEAG